MLKNARRRFWGRFSRRRRRRRAREREAAHDRGDRAGLQAYASNGAHVGCVGSHLEARYVLREGDVISVVSGTGARRRLTTGHARRGFFATLEAFDGVSELMARVSPSQFGGDVVGKDLADRKCCGRSRSFEIFDKMTASAFSSKSFDAQRRSNRI